MSLATKDTIVALAPELASEPDIRVDIFLDLALNVINPNAWVRSDRDPFKHAHAAMTAHMLTMANRGDNGAAGGPINRVKTGEVEIGYATATSAPADAELSQTIYGQIYLQLRKANIVAPMVV